MKTFVSKLGTVIAEFLDYKHALSIKYQTAEVYLHELDQYNFSHGNHDTLVKAVVDGWACEHAAKSTTSDRSWISPIRELGRYLVNIGNTSAYVIDRQYVMTSIL